MLLSRMVVFVISMSNKMRIIVRNSTKSLNWILFYWYFIFAIFELLSFFFLVTISDLIYRMFFSVKSADISFLHLFSRQFSRSKFLDFFPSEIVSFTSFFSVKSADRIFTSLFSVKSADRIFYIFFSGDISRSKNVVVFFFSEI